MTRRIVAIGGALISSMDETTRALEDFILELTGVRRPRVCFLPTAGNDADNYVRNFYSAFSEERCLPTHLNLVEPPDSTPAEVLLEQDVIYVSGGNIVSLLRVWRERGVDRVLRDAWGKGVILCGSSAGALCWFENGVTDSVGPTLAPFYDGLGFLPGSYCPHYDAETARRPAYEALVATAALPAGFASDDAVALLFRDRALETIVSTSPDAAAFRVTRAANGVNEERLTPKLISVQQPPDA